MQNTFFNIVESIKHRPINRDFLKDMFINGICNYTIFRFIPPPLLLVLSLIFICPVMHKIDTTLKNSRFHSRFKKIEEGNLIYLVMIFFTVTTLAILLSFRTAPFAEGWYTYYAKCMNNGLIVYKDFDYLFTPFYINFIAMICKFFGYNLFVLRIVGVIFFTAISIVVYFCFKDVFTKPLACLASIVAAFYLQTEVVQVFYDYVRLMDIFSCATTLCLVKYINSIRKNKWLMLAGCINSFFFLTKQNMGLLFFAFAFVFIFIARLIQQKRLLPAIKHTLLFFVSFLTPIILTALSMLIKGNLFDFIHLTGGDALAAKGGTMAVLFGWIKNNANIFVANIKIAAFALLFIALLFFIKNKFSKKEDELTLPLSVLSFSLAVFFYLFFVSHDTNYLKYITNTNLFNPYNIFLIVFTLFYVFVTSAIIMHIQKENVPNHLLSYIGITGAYFAISYGCGMSGGLAEGQATLGIAFIICIFFSELQFKHSAFLKIFFMFFCFLFATSSASKKMQYTYNWWGMDESNYWACSEKSKDIEILKNIKLSPQTKDAYETIYHAITENTNNTDTIYCFPQIPIFYNICNRSDPGVRAKVQWFDVASDKSIEADMELMKKKPPKAILIYETSEFAYKCHEMAFRNGNISATRKMKNFLKSKEIFKRKWIHRLWEY